MSKNKKSRMAFNPKRHLRRFCFMWLSNVEESAELIVAIKHKDTEMHPYLSASELRGNFLNFLEELADVKIMVSQAEYILESENPPAFEQYKRNIDFKLDREIKRIKNKNAI